MRLWLVLISGRHGSGLVGREVAAALRLEHVVGENVLPRQCPRPLDLHRIDVSIRFCAFRLPRRSALD